MFDSFPQKNRRDAQLIEFFRQQGVPDSQILFLKDAQATSRRVQNSFPTFLSKAGPDDLLVFYYTGHGYKSDDERTTYFATYDTGDNLDGWETEAIVRDVERYFKVRARCSPLIHVSQGTLRNRHVNSAASFVCDAGFGNFESHLDRELDLYRDAARRTARKIFCRHEWRRRSHAVRIGRGHQAGHGLR
jgi:hypothetical protein